MSNDELKKEMGTKEAEELEEQIEIIEQATEDEEKVEVTREGLTDDRIAALEEEKEGFKNALIQERADFENYKKRNADVASASYQKGVADAVTQLLPVLDNFERALSSGSEDKAFLDGMVMIQRQLNNVLTSIGVTEIDTDGKFDPNIHNALMQADEEGFESGDIIEVLQKGYKMKDITLRPANVKVNK